MTMISCLLEFESGGESMASQELRKLSRMELIDIIYQLRKDNDKLEQKLSETSSHLEEKQ